ncbi:MAG: hypothetical protein IKY98_00885 [Alphaproteobacteria bacterium]|nr:hypothetical protein [Alphaproteobacteria bacterium]
MKYNSDYHYLERLKLRMENHAKAIHKNTMKQAPLQHEDKKEEQLQKHKKAEISDELIEQVILRHEQLSGVPSLKESLSGRKKPIKQTLKQYFKEHRLDFVGIGVGLLLSLRMGWTTEGLVHDMWYSTLMVHFLFYVLTGVFIFATAPQNNPIAKLFAFIPFLGQMVLLVVASECLNIPFKWGGPLFTYLIAFGLIHTFMGVKNWLWGQKQTQGSLMVQKIANLFYFAVIGLMLFFVMFADIWGNISDTKQFILLLIFTLLMSVSMFIRVFVGWHQDNPDDLFQSALDPLNQGLKFVLLGVFSGYALVYGAILLFGFIFTHLEVSEDSETSFGEALNVVQYVVIAVMIIGGLIVKALENPSSMSMLNTGWGYVLIYIYLFWPMHLFSTKILKS